MSFYKPISSREFSRYYFNSKRPDLFALKFTAKVSSDTLVDISELIDRLQIKGLKMEQNSELTKAALLSFEAVINQCMISTGTKNPTFDEVRRFLDSDGFQLTLG